MERSPPFLFCRSVPVPIDLAPAEDSGTDLCHTLGGGAFARLYEWSQQQSPERENEPSTRLFLHSKTNASYPLSQRKTFDFCFGGLGLLRVDCQEEVYKRFVAV